MKREVINALPGNHYWVPDVTTSTKIIKERECRYCGFRQRFVSGEWITVRRNRNERKCIDIDIVNRDIT